MEAQFNTVGEIVREETRDELLGTKKRKGRSWRTRPGKVVEGTLVQGEDGFWRPTRKRAIEVPRERKAAAPKATPTHCKNGHGRDEYAAKNKAGNVYCTGCHGGKKATAEEVVSR